jgi:hypothetical protein
MAQVDWAAVEAVAAPLFAAGATPERADLVEAAFAAGGDDDLVDAFDSLGPRPIPSLAALREQLAANGVLA